MPRRLKVEGEEPPVTINGKLIAESRLQRQVAQADLAKIAGISTSTLSRIERGIVSVVPAWTAKAIARALDVQTESFLATAVLSKGAKVQKRADTYLRAAYLFNHAQDFPHALEMANYAYEEAEQENDEITRAQCSIFIVGLEYLSNRLFGDLEMLEQAIVILAASAQKRFLAGALLTRATVGLRTGNWALVADSLDWIEGLELDEPEYPHPLFLSAVVPQYRGELLYYQGRYEEAAREFEKALTASYRKKPATACSALGMLGLAWYREGRKRNDAEKVQAGVNNVKEAVRTDRDSLESREGEGKWYHGLGAVLVEERRYDLALMALKRSEKLRRELPSSDLPKTKALLEKVSNEVGETRYQELVRQYAAETQSRDDGGRKSTYPDTEDFWSRVEAMPLEGTGVPSGEHE